MKTSSLSTLLGLGLLGLGLLALACDKPTTVTPEQPQIVETTPVEAAPAKAEWPNEPFRAERPQPKSPKPLVLPGVSIMTLSNGLEVRFVEQTSIPTLTMYLEWDLGDANDPRNKAGMNALCTNLLDESTASLDHAAFMAKQADHAVTISANADPDVTMVEVRTLARELGPALDLFAEVITAPGLRADDFERLVAHAKSRIEGSRSTPTMVANRVWGSVAWGGNHPYGKIPTAKSVDAIKLDDCKAWAAKLRPEGARLWVVGKIAPEELRKQLEARFSSWTGKAPKPLALPKPKPAKGTIFFVDVPGAAQSMILLGHPGLSRDAADFEATQMMAAIFGGSFSSRLNMNLREDKGWAYGARGSYYYTRGGSMLLVSSSVRTDATAGALREIAKEIERMRTSDPSSEELTREREGAQRALPATFATASRTLSAYRDLEYHGLPTDWHEGYAERLAKLDVAAITKAAAAHLPKSGYVVVVAGDAAVVLPELEKLADEHVFGKGGLLFLDADGEPVEPPR